MLTEIKTVKGFPDDKIVFVAVPQRLVDDPSFDLGTIVPEGADQATVECHKEGILVDPQDPDKVEVNAINDHAVIFKFTL